MCELSIYMAGKVKDCMDSTSGGAPKFNHWYVLNLIKPLLCLGRKYGELYGSDQKRVDISKTIMDAFKNFHMI